MERFETIIIGGGAAGLTLACALLHKQKNILLLERNDRVGKKLSSTGNGQGNVTNLGVESARYFSSAPKKDGRISRILKAYDQTALCRDLETLGVLTLADERGRVYPTGRQASSITDALRFYIAEQGGEMRLGTTALDIQKTNGGFFVAAQTQEGKTEYFAQKVVLCAGGKAAKNFGTDGTAYAMAQKLGHSVTPLYPSLVQLKTDTAWTKTLKGIRINDGIVRLYQGERLLAEEKGDVIFTDYGVSGDAIFRISAFATDKQESADLHLTLDFLPAVEEEQLRAVLTSKKARFSTLSDGELFGGILNNQVGRAVCKRANFDTDKAAALAKSFPLKITGSLGFDYAQVTKGGIPLTEVDEDLQSVKAQGVYFAGEILDVDGQCGGYNLQWAYASARVVADAICGK